MHFSRHPRWILRDVLKCFVPGQVQITDFDQEYAFDLDPLPDEDRHRGELVELCRWCRMPPNAVVLDMGCNTGKTTKRLHEWGFQPFGIDVNKVAIDIAGQRYPDIPFVPYDGENLPFANRSVDAVIMVLCLDNIPNAEQLFGELHRVLKPNGVVGIITRSAWHKLVVFPRNFWNGYYPDLTTYRYYFPCQLRSLLKNTGFEVERVVKIGSPVVLGTQPRLLAVGRKLA